MKLQGRWSRSHLYASFTIYSYQARSFSTAAFSCPVHIFASVEIQFWQRQKPDYKFLCVRTSSMGLRCSCNRITVASWSQIFYLWIKTTAECVWTQECQGPSLQTPPSWSWKNEQLPPFQVSSALFWNQFKRQSIESILPSLPMTLQMSNSL